MKSFIVFIFLALLKPAVQAQVPSDTLRQAWLTAAREIMSRSSTCALITLDQKGVAQVRTMDPFSPEEDFTVWLATNPNSRKVAQIRKNSNVVLHYTDQDENGYVTIHGKAELVNNQQDKDAHWKEEWKSFYPNRNDQYLLIKITPEYLEVINYKKGVNGDPQTWQPAKVAFK